MLASKASARWGVPALLLFIGIGMLAGSEGLGGIPFDDARLTQNVGVVALALILFSGGLQTSFAHIRGMLWRGLSLATIGVVLTAAATGWFASWVLKIPLAEGLLMGAILSSTDAAAVFSVLRSSGGTLKARLGQLLEVESGSNDPMGVFLTIAMIRWITEPGVHPLDLAGLFFLQMGIGLAAGILFGRLAVWAVNRIDLTSEGLYPVLTLGMVLGIYGVTAAAGGSGFLAVYVVGVLMNRHNFVHKKSLVRFHDGIAWLTQIVMFLALGLLCYPSQLVRVADKGLLIALFLMFIARPLAVFASLAAAGMSLRQRLFVSWVGLRGAVPIVLATFPMFAGIANANLYFNVVFFAVLSSVLIQGTTLPALAARLGLRAPMGRPKLSPFEFTPLRWTRSEMTEITVGDGAPIAGRQLIDLKLPQSALIILLGRGEEYLVPRGTTRIESGDTMLVLADRTDIARLRDLAGATADEEENA